MSESQTLAHISLRSRTVRLRVVHSHVSVGCAAFYLLRNLMLRVGMHVCPSHMHHWHNLQSCMGGEHYFPILQTFQILAQCDEINRCIHIKAKRYEKASVPEASTEPPRILGKTQGLWKEGLGSPLFPTSPALRLGDAYSATLTALLT